jgi:hypothetical protein
VNEKKFRHCVIEMLKPVGAFSVENMIGVGCPDVCTTLGWIELKVARRPVRPTSAVSVDLRPAQMLWLRKWRKLGGRAFTLTLLMPREGEEGVTLWLLHDGAWAAEHLGSTAEGPLVLNSAMTEPFPTTEQLITALSQPMMKVNQ